LATVSPAPVTAQVMTTSLFNVPPALTRSEHIMLAGVAILNPLTGELRE
jgi:hypothetical protein